MSARRPTSARYGSVFARLVANTAEPDNAQACWTWTGPTRRHAGGLRPSITLRTPGAGRAAAPKQHNAARVMLRVLGELRDETLEASHLCVGNWLCINPDHLVAEPKRANLQRRGGREVPLPAPSAAPDAEDPPWDLVGEPHRGACPF